MTVSPEIAAQILRLFEVEKWRIGTIAARLRVHHSVVRRVIRRGEKLPPAARPSKLEPFWPFIHETLARHPRLTAKRLFEMIRERGYRGGPDHFRHVIASVRTRPPAEAFLPRTVLPAEEAQVDWAFFGRVQIGRAVRQLMAFVMVLSYSRAIFLRFYLGQHVFFFLHGHVTAFSFFGGVARALLYDNLRSAVLERVGDAIRFNPLLIDFSAHYRFEPRPVAVCRGNEKGRVERAIGYVRTSFFAGRTWRDLDDLNAQALQWCQGLALDRRWPEDRSRTVRDVFEEERPRLLSLPQDPFPVAQRVEVSLGKYPYARFDKNDYSVPHVYARRTLTVLAELDTLRILSGNEVIATHRRSYDQGERIEDSEHFAALTEVKRKAKQSRNLSRLEQAAPESRRLLEELAAQGQNLGSPVRQLLRLLDVYGASRLNAAIRQALAHGATHPHGVRHILEKNQRKEGTTPRLPLSLAKDHLQQITVRTHSLGPYDHLSGKECPDVVSTENTDPVS